MTHDARLVEEHVAAGKACALRGHLDAARENYTAALAIDGDAFDAHVALAELGLPGEHYRDVLARIYEHLEPATVLEIGVEAGLSLAVAPASATVIGVDPAPRVEMPMRAAPHLHAETSDAFFEARRLDGLLGGRPLDVAFIDGLHLFEQALRDFVNAERYCGPRSVVMLHDTIPLDEPTQRRVPETRFHTGDVWKTAVCLRHYRGDLNVFTVATPWSGLTLVTGFRSEPPVFAERYDEAVERFIDMPFDALTARRDELLGVVPNDWQAIRRRLDAVESGVWS